MAVRPDPEVGFRRPGDHLRGDRLVEVGVDEDLAALVISLRNAELQPREIREAARLEEGDPVMVEVVPDGQLSKEAGRTAYTDESPPPPKIQAPPDFRDRGIGRPTKKDRREIEKWKR